MSTPTYSARRWCCTIVYAALIIGCGPAGQAKSVPVASTAPTNLHWLALGDSYTIGEGVGEAERWPSQLTRALQARGLAVAAPDVVAATGWTADELMQALEARSDLREQYDLVSLSIGVNNQYRGREVGQFAEEFIGLLSTAIGFTGGDARRVIVVSIPDWGVSPFAAANDADATEIAAAIDEFNAMKARISENARSPYVDVTTISRQNAEPGDFAADGLHPSQRQYSAWVESILPAAVQILSTDP